MTIESLLSTLAAFIGFGASLFFIIGSVTLNNLSILNLATPFFDFHKGIARSQSQQKWFHTFGAFLLFIAFISQISALAPLEMNNHYLPFSQLEGFIAAGLATFFLWVVLFFFCLSLISKTYREVENNSILKKEQAINAHKEAATNKQNQADA